MGWMTRFRLYGEELLGQEVHELIYAETKKGLGEVQLLKFVGN